VLVHIGLNTPSLGFSSQGNEFSHYMLLGSFFVLNRYFPARARVSPVC
jgi:carnosine N-methyltransferase